MDTVLQIGITGGIGSGKSLVCKIFKTLGVSIYDADSRAKMLMNTDQVLIDQIKNNFGSDAYSVDGTLDRTYLSKTVFISEKKLTILNQLVHPRVAVDFELWVRQRQKSYIIKEAALLFESGSYRGLDKIIVVTAPEQMRIKRVLQRDPQRTAADVHNIINNQMPEEEKVKRADFCVVNDETQLLIPQVLTLHQMFSEQKL